MKQSRHRGKRLKPLKMSGKMVYIPVQPVIPEPPEEMPPMFTVAEAMEYLHTRHPDFFDSLEKQQLAAIILAELSDAFRNMDTVERAGALAQIMTLMYRMGSAAIKSTNSPQDMTAIFINENFK